MFTQPALVNAVEADHIANALIQLQRPFFEVQSSAEPSNLDVFVFPQIKQWGDAPTSVLDETKSNLRAFVSAGNTLVMINDRGNFGLSIINNAFGYSLERSGPCRAYYESTMRGHEVINIFF